MIRDRDLESAFPFGPLHLRQLSSHKPAYPYNPTIQRPCPKPSKVCLSLNPTLQSTPTAHDHNSLTPLTGVLVECDPSIKAIILKIDQDKHDYIVEDLDDQTLVVKESQLPNLKARLEEVWLFLLV